MSNITSKKFVPFSKPDIGHEEIDHVVSVLKSGWLTTGPKSRKFEYDFAEMLGSDVTTVADRAFSGVVRLPLFSAMTDDDVEFVVSAVREIFQEHVK